MRRIRSHKLLTTRVRLAKDVDPAVRVDAAPEKADGAKAGDAAVRVVDVIPKAGAGAVRAAVEIPKVGAVAARAAGADPVKVHAVKAGAVHARADVVLVRVDSRLVIRRSR